MVKMKRLHIWWVVMFLFCGGYFTWCSGDLGEVVADMSRNFVSLDGFTEAARSSAAGWLGVDMGDIDAMRAAMASKFGTVPNSEAQKREYDSTVSVFKRAPGKRAHAIAELCVKLAKIEPPYNPEVLLGYLKKFDVINKYRGRFDFDVYEERIKQLPGLQQTYVLHPAYYVNGTNMCAYYALFFAKAFLENCGREEGSIVDALNDRDTFNSFLAAHSWFDPATREVARTNLETDNVATMITRVASLHDHCAVFAQDFIELVEVGVADVPFMVLVNQFKRTEEPVAFIVRVETPGFYATGHYILVFAEKSKNSGIRLTIVSSYDVDERANEMVVRLAGYILG
jgi:hypothetical protein